MLFLLFSLQLRGAEQAVEYSLLRMSDSRGMLNNLMTLGTSTNASLASEGALRVGAVGVYVHARASICAQAMMCAEVFVYGVNGGHTACFGVCDALREG